MIGDVEGMHEPVALGDRACEVLLWLVFRPAGLRRYHQVPAASKAARISFGWRTKSNASTFCSPSAASLSSDPRGSAENSAASEYSWTEASGKAIGSSFL